MRWLETKLPLWKKALGSLAGGLLVVWGLLSLPSEIKDKAESLRSTVPAWILLSVGLLLIAVIWGSSWWASLSGTKPSPSPAAVESDSKALAAINAAWETKLAKARHDVTQAEGLASMYRQERDQLREEAKGWSERLAFVGEERKRAESDAADVRRELGREATRLSLALQEANDRSRDWCWQARYGVAYPSDIPDKFNDLHTLSAMRPRLDEHIGVCKELAKRTEVILAWIIGNMKNSNNQDAKDWLGRFLEEYVWERFTRATALLEESREDPRAAMVAFYSRYEPARRWIGHGLPLVIKVEKDGLDPNWGRVFEYQEWLQADSAFMADVKRLKSIMYLQPVMKYLPEGLFQWLPIPLKASAPQS